MYRVRLRLLPRRGRRCVFGTTTMGPEGCDRDRASIVSRVYLGWEKTRSLGGGRQFFFSDLCERVREVRKTDDGSFVCVRDVLG